MCLRPDIVYVVSMAVYDSYLALLEEHLYPDSVGYHEGCDEQVEAADQAGDAERLRHWRLVKDFATRYGCSPLSAIEVDGEIYHQIELPHPVPDANLIRVVIGDPRNPPHEHQQPKITLVWQRDNS